MKNKEESALWMNLSRANIRYAEFMRRHGTKEAAMEFVHLHINRREQARALAKQEKKP